jgi:hypothetical protein
MSYHKIQRLQTPLGFMQNGIDLPKEITTLIHFKRGVEK